VLDESPVDQTDPGENARRELRVTFQGK